MKEHCRFLTHEASKAFLDGGVAIADYTSNPMFANPTPRRALPVATPWPSNFLTGASHCDIIWTLGVWREYEVLPTVAVTLLLLQHSVHARVRCL